MDSEDLQKEFLKERRRERRWKNVRFVGWVAVLLAAIGAVQSLVPVIGKLGDQAGQDTEGPYVAVVRMTGAIGANHTVSADRVIEGLNAAFQDKSAKGILLWINSPGGSPVQSYRIYERIRTFKEDHPDKPVVVYGGETLASGAYYAAAAADRIYVSPATVTGSIGVIMQGYQYKGLLNWMQVKARVVTAGKHKDRLVPTRKWSKADRAKMKGVVEHLHHQFIEDVRAARGNRLKTAKAELFSGDFWTGGRAKELGLVDGLGTPRSVLQEEFGTTETVDHTAGLDWEATLRRVTQTVIQSIKEDFSARGGSPSATLN